jgi:radical SAM superfamily enzyme YgiQ (UPF0313 family)
MRILFIHIGLGDAGFGNFGKSAPTSRINHGLCSIGAYAKSYGYHTIKLMDMRKLKGWDHFKQTIKRERFDICAISFMSCDFNAAKKVTGIVREVCPAAKIVVGGVHPTVATEEVGAVNGIDHIVVGEGEISFVNLLDDIKAGRKTERIIMGITPNLNDLPFEDRELFDYETSIKFTNFPGFFKPPMVTVVASRGCPFNCSFCAPHAKTMFGLKVRYRSVDHVIQELEGLYDKYKFKSIAFFDYSLFLNKAWMYEFCDKFERTKIKAQIWANCRADLISSNEEGIERMSEVGLRMIAVGMESGSQRILDFMKKGTTVEQNIRAAEICKKNGIAVRGLFMLGLPTETKEDVQATLDLIKKVRPDVYSFSYFTPMPGTHLYEYCEKHNLSLIKSSDELADMGPNVPKIKGVDYEYLKGAVEEAMGYRFGGKFVGRCIRYLSIRSRSRYLLTLRHFFKYLYARWVLIRSRFIKEKTLSKLS